MKAVALRQALNATGTERRWCHSHAQLADAFTKSQRSAIHVLRSFLRKGYWKLGHDEFFLSARKRRTLNKDVSDETTGEDRQTLKERQEAAEAESKTKDMTSGLDE